MTRAPTDATTQKTYRTPAGKDKELSALRERLIPFGLDPRDDDLWNELSKVIHIIAVNYLDQHKPAIDFPSTQESLKKIHEGLSKVIKYLDELSDPGKDYILGVESDHENYTAAGQNGFNPKTMKFYADGIFEKAFELQIINDKRRLDNGANLSKRPFYNSYVGPEGSYGRALKKYYDAQNGYSADRSIPNQKYLKECARSLWCEQQALERYGCDASGHIDGKIEELAAFRDLVEIASRTFERSWEGSGAVGARGKFRPKMPRTWLAGKLIEMIGEYWGAEGVRHVSPSYTGKEGSDAGRFSELLSAVHQYATGSSGEEVREALNDVTEMRENALLKYRT